TRSLAGLAETLRRQFESAWQEALAGRPPPQIDTYLTQVPEAERTALRGELDRLERDYRQRHQVAGLTTADMATTGPAGPAVPPLWWPRGRAPPGRRRPRPRPRGCAGGPAPRTGMPRSSRWAPTAPQSRQSPPWWPGTRSRASWAGAGWASSTRPGRRG